ncbi:MAG: RHS repeat-associated core domain-containing protein [Candidatus Omnitrophica bacterium]|nr:RHS repeat-associated core domain-containing protein [Candidatus Omnitrophota bacterium]
MLNKPITFDNVRNRTNFTKITSLDTETINSQFNQLNQLNSWSSSLLNSGNIVSLSGTLSDANIDYISVNSQTSTIDSNTFTINDLGLNPGLNTLTINAQDKAGNSAQANLAITLDNTVSAVYGYDPDGNLISRSEQGTTWNYTWNAENKLIKASSSLGKSIDYRYYEDGNLGSKTSQDTTKYIYDGIHCIAKYDAGNQLVSEIVYGPQIDEVLCSLDNVDTAHYYHQDALQSVTVITDGFANKSATYEYDVYGKIKDKIGSFDNEILYTGRWLDEETGLYYYRARWYDADSGRFISRDPIGTAGGINLYGYVGNGVVNKLDPRGMSPWDYVPIVRNVRAKFITPKGGHVSDYAKFAVTKESCCDDALEAEARCMTKIRNALGAHEAILLGSSIAYVGVEIMIAGGGLFAPPAGYVITAVGIVDAVGNVPVTFANIFDIYHAAKAARDTYCESIFKKIT